MSRLLATEVKARCLHGGLSLSSAIPRSFPGAGVAFPGPCRCTGSCTAEVPWSSMSTAPFALSLCFPLSNLRIQAVLGPTLCFHAGSFPWVQTHDLVYLS